MEETKSIKLIKTIEEVYEESPMILLDTSIAQRELNDWYSLEVYPAKIPSDLTTEFLEIELNDAYRFKNLVLDDKSFTVSNVTRELKRFLGLLQGKLQSFNYIEKQRKRNHKEVASDEHSNMINKSLFEELNFSYSQICRLIEKKQVKIEYPDEFNKLEKIVEQIIETTGAKNKSRVKQFRNLEHHEDFRADDQLATTALYFSLIERKSNTIFAADGDIKRIVNNTYHHLKQLYHYSPIMDSLRKNPLRVYFFDGQKAYACIDTALSKILIKREDYEIHIPPQTE